MRTSFDSLPGPRVQYECPLCDWTFEEPSPNDAGITPSVPGADLQDLIADIVVQVMRRQLAEVEAAFREHFAMHTAQVMLEAP